MWNGFDLNGMIAGCIYVHVELDLGCNLISSYEEIVFSGVSSIYYYIMLTRSWSRMSYIDLF